MRSFQSRAVSRRPRFLKSTNFCGCVSDPLFGLRHTGKMRFHHESLAIPPLIYAAKSLHALIPERSALLHELFTETNHPHGISTVNRCDWTTWTIPRS